MKYNKESAEKAMREWLEVVEEVINEANDILDSMGYVETGFNIDHDLVDLMMEDI